MLFFTPLVSSSQFSLFPSFYLIYTDAIALYPTSLLPPAVPAVPASSSFSIPSFSFCSPPLFLSMCLFCSSALPSFTHALLYCRSLQTLSYKSQTVSLPPLWSVHSVSSPLCSPAAVRTYCSTLMTVLSGQPCTRGLKRWDIDTFGIMSFSKPFLKRNTAPFINSRVCCNEKALWLPFSYFFFLHFNLN